MPVPLLAGKPAVYLVHAEHGGGAWFPDDPAALNYHLARGWEPAEPPVEVDEFAAADPQVSPESPAPKKTSKAAKSAETKGVTGG